MTFLKSELERRVRKVGEEVLSLRGIEYETRGVLTAVVPVVGDTEAEADGVAGSSSRVRC